MPGPRPGAGSLHRVGHLGPQGLLGAVGLHLAPHGRAGGGDNHEDDQLLHDSLQAGTTRRRRAGTTTAFANSTQAACLPSIPLVNCTTNTLQPDAVNSTWLWADDRHLGPSGQTSLGSLAVTRAQNNPF